ncbi:MAG: SpoIIE family protein phosphatase, partial [Acidobacteriota bacterium]
GYGLVVYFEGNERSGWGYWLTDTTSAGNAEEARGWRNFGRVRFVASALLFLVLATLFYRFYDAGKLRLRRALQVAAFVGGAGALWLASFIAHRGPAQDVLIWWVLLGSLFVVLVAFLAFLVAGVGEALARRGWRQRLAAFEALFRGHWRNATVARSMLHGLTLGTFGAGLAVAATLPMRWFGITPSGGQVLASAFRNGVPGVGTLLHDLVIFQVPQFLALLVAVPFLCRRFGMRIGGALSLPVVALMVAPPFQPVPAAESLPWLLAVTAIPLGLFLWSDLLSALLAALVMRMLVVAFPLLLAKDPWLLAGGVVALGAVLIPPSAALFYLFSNRSFTYRFDPMGDVPTEVLERVAERERQRFELETARVVHDAILPELPERCRGVEIAHAYQAATEIGGDFYDVLPLADERRVAVALGDVAGHGVASGLVMSALRGALQVHVRFEPRVTQVFENLNRLLTDGAQRKLLTTLAYGVLDPESGRFVYASAGHPLYVVRADGSLVDLAPRSYPLGVRRHLRIGTSEVELGPGDALFLFSDGLLESCAGNGDEPFGYNRLEESLRRYAGGSAQDLLAGVLQEVADFAGAGSPDDDVTLLVLRLE